MVLTMTSRARTLDSNPMPIFQLKPRGAMAGSMKWPRRADDAIGELRCGVGAVVKVNGRDVREDPESERNHENNGSGLAEEDAGAIDEADCK
jgi:hypothetical protein